MSPKQRAIQAVRQCLSHAEDNLYRAESEFKGQDLRVQHGSSGKTRNQVLAEYGRNHTGWKQALAWVTNSPER